MTDYHQGEIVWAQLDPVRGSEQSGRRPVVILSGNTLNETLPICIVCPLTTQVRGTTGRVHVSANKMTGLKQDSEIIVFQIRTVSQERLGKKLGRITSLQLRSSIESLGELLKY